MKHLRLFSTMAITAIMIIFTNLGFGQSALIHYFNFNDNMPPTNINWDQPISAQTGTGQLTYTFTQAYSFAGTSINGVAGEVNGGSFSPRGGAGNINNGEHFILTLASLNFENLVLSYATRRTSTGFTTQEIQYTTNGTTWLTKETIDISGFANSWVLSQVITVDFTGIPGVDDNTNFAIRIVLNGASTEAGNNRFDNIQLTGTPIGTSAASKLAVTQINAGSPVFVNQSFSVKVQSQDQFGIPQNVVNNVSVQLSKATGTGNLGGTLSGLILAGTNEVVITGVTYDFAEPGVSITASTLFGGLDPGTSALFEVLPTPLPVVNIAALRAGTLGTIYTLTGQAVLTFQQPFRNQKYIQDATAAILIDDAPNGNTNPGVITTTYNLGDGITSITGTLNEFGNMMQFTPLLDPGTATSSGNVITPQVVTLSQLNSNFDDYEAQLVKIMNVSFTNAGGTFANGQVYPILGGSEDTINFRTTFFDVDYIGTDIPFIANIVCLPNARAEGDFVTSRSLADFEITGLPFITKAYALSPAAVDVFYNINMTSVDPDDYYLLGTANTIFTGATIDGVNPKLVHLTGATPAMASDLILDEIFDDNFGTSYQFYAGISPIANTNTTNPGGTLLDGVDATFTGILSGNNGSSRVWVSDAAGAYNGVLIFDNTFPSQVSVGDQITFTAVRNVFNNQTELINPTLISVASAGNTPYGPTLIPGSYIASNIPANTNPAESFEGQLVKIEDFTVDSLSAFGTNYACSWSDGVNTHVFYIGNGAGNFIMDVGSTYTAITGLVDWYWTGNFFRINPRNQDDIEFDFIPPVKLAITSVNDGFDPSENLFFAVIVQAQDADGFPAITLSNITFTFSTNGGTSGDVDFTAGSTTGGTILAGTNEVIVYGVRMAPIGANVTITASDNDPAGLQSGTSDPFDVLILPEMLAAWTFDDTPPSPNTPTSVSANLGFQLGSATLYADGTNGSSLWDESELTTFGGTLINDPRTDGSAIAGASYVPRGGTSLSANGNRMVLKFSMINFKDPILSFATRGTSTGFDLHQWEWSIDNVTFTPFGTNTATRSANFSPRVLNMSAIDQLDQAPEVYLRVTFDGATTTTGNNRLDNIVIRATEVEDFDFFVDLKVFLEGPFDPLTTNMANTLNSENLLPNLHPFNPAIPYYGNNAPKWLYNGPGSVVSFNPGVVDWVLVELRDAPTPGAATSATSVSRRPGLLLSDGSIVALNGTSPVGFNATFNDFMFIAVWSRNHLGVMSSAGIANPTGTVSWDFTTGAGQTFGTDGSKELTTGVWGMYSGDVNADGTINNDDKTPDGWASEAGEQGYLSSDLNLDSQSDNVDKNNFWLPNYLKNSQVPN